MQTFENRDDERATQPARLLVAQWFAGSSPRDDFRDWRQVGKISMAARARVHVGTSGWSYAHWRDSFYATDVKPRGYLAAYAEQFRTAEVNNTFYRLPERKSVEEWRDSVPDDFVFAVKASRFMTHMKKLKDPEQPIAALFDRVEVLGEKLGPILVQCPPRWRRNRERLEAFLKALPADRDFAFEFRDPSWFHDEIYELLARHGSALCVYDQDGKVSPEVTTTDWGYVRFHRPGRHDTWDYSEDQLVRWAGRCAAWAGDGRTVYCYFNNDLDGAAPRNARRLIEILDQCGYR